MQTSDIGSKHQDCRLLTPIVKRASIGEVLHHFQSALLNFDTSDCGLTAIVSLLPLISLFQPGTNSATAKG
jgi:hypothetical protein